MTAYSHIKKCKCPYCKDNDVQARNRKKAARRVGKEQVDRDGRRYGEVK